MSVQTNIITIDTTQTVIANAGAHRGANMGAHIGRGGDGNGAGRKLWHK